MAQKPRQIWYGTVYLLHFSEPYHHARHYVGWTTNQQGRTPIEIAQDRLDEHLDGLGSPLVRAVHNRGILVVVARVWANQTRGFERRIHNLRPKRIVCPLCVRMSAVTQPRLSIPCLAD